MIFPFPLHNLIFFPNRLPPPPNPKGGIRNFIQPCLKVKGLTQSSSATASPPHKSARTRPEEKESSAPTPKRPRVNSAVKQRNIIPPVTVDLDPPALPVKSEPAAPPVESHAMAAVEDYPGAGGGAVEPMYGDEFGEFEGGYGGEDQGYNETMMDSNLAGTPSADGNKGRKMRFLCRVSNVMPPIPDQPNRLTFIKFCSQQEEEKI